MLVWRDVSSGGDADAGEEGETVIQRGIVVESGVLGRVTGADDANGSVRGSRRAGVCRNRLRPVALPAR
jgi:hypothetical protein